MSTVGTPDPFLQSVMDSMHETSPDELASILAIIVQVVGWCPRASDIEIEAHGITLRSLSERSLAVEILENRFRDGCRKVQRETIIIVSFEYHVPYTPEGPVFWVAPPADAKAYAYAFGTQIVTTSHPEKIREVLAVADRWPGDISPEIMPAEMYRFCRLLFERFPDMEPRHAAEFAAHMADISSTWLHPPVNAWPALRVAGLAFADHKAGITRKLRGEWLPAEDDGT